MRLHIPAGGGNLENLLDQSAAGYLLRSQNVAISVGDHIAHPILVEYVVIPVASVIVFQLRIPGSAQLPAGIPHRDLRSIAGGIAFQGFSVGLRHILFVQLCLYHHQDASGTAQDTQQGCGTKKDGNELKYNMVFHPFPPSIL